MSSPNEWQKPRTVFAATFYFLLVLLIIGYSFAVIFDKEVNALIPESLKILLGVLISTVSALMGYYWGQKTKERGHE